MSMPLQKLGAISAGASAVLGPFFTALNVYIPVPFIGVPVGMYGASALGAAVSLFFGEKPPTRKQQFGQVVGAIVFGAQAAEPLADILFMVTGWQWPQLNSGSFALFCGALMRWYLAKIIKKGSTFIDEYKFTLPFFKKKRKPEAKDET